MSAISMLRARLSERLWTIQYGLILPAALRTRWFPHLYYGLLNRSFAREHHAVLSGKWMHLRAESEPSADFARLCRGVHRIEKALISPRLKPVFAEGYITETVATYRRLNESGRQPETLRWAQNVLGTYFEQVTPTPIIRNAEAAFRRITAGPDSEDAPARVPYKRSSIKKSTTTYPEFLALCKQRRSVRYYRSDPVPTGLLRQAIEAASQAPSACNRQPFRFVVFDKPDLLDKVTRLPMGTDSFAHNIGMMVLVIGDLSAYFSERDRHTIYIDGALASMSFMLALETLGLSSCPINWPDIPEREERLAALLSLRPCERCILFISVGYALEEGMIPYSQKKSFETLVQMNPPLQEPAP